MIKDRVSLANMNLCDIYKVIYDGFGSRNATVSTECINYLRQNYYFFNEAKYKEKYRSKKKLEKSSP